MSSKESIALEQQQQQRQALVPRQVQYALLLEMTGPEIEEEIRGQLDDNPALEEDIDATATVDDRPDGGEDEGEAGDESGEAGEGPEEPVPDKDYDPGYDPEDDHPEGLGTTARDDQPSMQIANDAPGLHESLIEQVGQLYLPEQVARIARYIIGNIDDDGRLTRSLQDMANDIEIHTGQDVSMADMRAAYDAVRSLDPAGVGAVDLRDCLLLQIERSPRTLESRVAYEIVAHNFDLLSKKHYDQLQAQLGLDDRKPMAEALKYIRTLNPKPGSAMAAGAQERSGQIAPDVEVEELDDGRISVSLASRLPQLQVSRSFTLDGAPGKPLTKAEREAQAFIKLKRDDAEAFISALRQRGRTLLSVTEAIVKRQPEFFATGDVGRLRPMILKDIAADTGLDLSTISRATAGKYMATRFGSFPLKMFFNEAPTDDGNMSSHQLREAMRRIIDGEDKRHPLSDEEILNALKEQGYKIAHRTVTKYREKMGIPVSRLRKSEA